jgi:hypothetical protein
MTSACAGELLEFYLAFGSGRRMRNEYDRKVLELLEPDVSWTTRREKIGCGYVGVDGAPATSEAHLLDGAWRL